MSGIQTPLVDWFISLLKYGKKDSVAYGKHRIYTTFSFGI